MFLLLHFRIQFQEVGITLIKWPDPLPRRGSG